MSDDIKRLPVHNKRADEGKLFLVRPPTDKCKHTFSQFEIDENAGKCRCKKCGGEVSPMFVLAQLMKYENRWMMNRANYKDEMKRLHERARTKCRHCGKMTDISRR